eukprot:scaffold40501_cov65-Phaeocystis_antarctica.AAC.1
MDPASYRLWEPSEYAAHNLHKQHHSDNHCSPLLTRHMVPAAVRHMAAFPASWAFPAGAGCSAAARS